jgi:hypothetical protein
MDSVEYIVNGLKGEKVKQLYKGGDSLEAFKIRDAALLKPAEFDVIHMTDSTGTDFRQETSTARPPKAAKAKPSEAPIEAHPDFDKLKPAS